MDQYVSWCLPAEELTVDTILGKFEEFCKPQYNEVRAYFDLLTSFRKSNKSVDEWYNAVQTQVNLAQYPPETAKILHRNIFWFFLQDEEFASRTIRHQCTELPAGKYKKKKSSVKSRQSNYKQHRSNMEVPRCKASTRRGLLSRVPTRAKRGPKCGDSAHVEGFQCTAKKLPEKTSSFQIKEAKGAPITSRYSICQR